MKPIMSDIINNSEMKDLFQTIKVRKSSEESNAKKINTKASKPVAISQEAKVIQNSENVVKKTKAVTKKVKSIV